MYWGSLNPLITFTKIGVILIISTKSFKLALPIYLILLCDFVLLANNYRISEHLDMLSANINIAGRQRMLSQKITKALTLVQHEIHNNKPLETNINELNNAITLFDNTLNAFASGAYTLDPSGNRLFIKKLSQPNIKSIISESQQLWLPLHSQLTKFLDKSTIDPEELNSLIDVMSQNNNKLLKLMNDLTISLEQEAKEQVVSLRTFQIVIVILISASFLLLTMRFQRREKYYAQLMEKSTDIIMSIDISSRTISFISDSVKTLLGYKVNDCIDKKALMIFTDRSQPIVEEILSHLSNTQTLEQDRYEVELIHNKGTTIVADMVLEISTSEDGKRLELNADIRDISERKETEKVLLELAHQDPLTGLANRELFFQLAKQSIKLAERNKSSFALLFLDLNKFKQVNDNYGHDIGDKVLIEVSQRIAQSLRDSDTVARVGGDEFIILLQNINACEINSIELVAQQIIDNISKEIVINEIPHQVGASIGIALYPNHTKDLEKLIKLADTAMYESKNSQQSNIIFAPSPSDKNSQ